MVAPFYVSVEYWSVIGLMASVLIQAVLLTMYKPRETSSSSNKADTVLEVIKTRRSVKPKDFSDEPLSRADLEDILTAANYAPTHGKSEPWRFTVLLGPAALQGFQELCSRILTERGDQAKAEYVRKEMTSGKFKTVKAMVLVGMKRKALPDKTMPEWEETCAVAAAVQNMLLQAHASGLSGYWSSLFEGTLDAPAMGEYMGLDFAAGDKCFGAFIVGKAIPERLEGYRASRKPIADKVIWK